VLLEVQLVAYRSCEKGNLRRGGAIRKMLLGAEVGGYPRGQVFFVKRIREMP